MYQSITDLQRENIKGKKIVASISGGKDSAALSLWLHENGVEHERVFADTGWEHPLTYEYLRGELTSKIGPITELKGKFDFKSLVKKKGMFPSRRLRFCTQELKAKPFIDYYEKQLEQGFDCVNALGIRADESQDRAKMPEWDWSLEVVETWRPLLQWTFDDVVEIHKRHDLKPNPLYFLGAERVGCFPCINSNKEQIKLVASLWPERIQEIEELEQELSEGKPRPRTFFQTRGTKELYPIRKVVEWSKTARGGRQYELFAEPADSGCLRWGMCDLPSE